MTGQDWLEKDFYAALGVPKDASDADLKKAYRKLARTHHPDQNQGDPASEEKFKEIGEAYSVLSDPEKRQQYDSLRAMAGGGPRFASGPGGAAGFDDHFGGMFGGAGHGSSYPASGSGGGFNASQFEGGFEDILSGMFGGGGPAGFGRNQAAAGRDLAAATTIPFRSAVEGAKVALSVSGRTLNVRIPAGVKDGQKIRLRGKGEPGRGGGPAGDLLMTVAVESHPVYGMDGRNLTITVPVTFPEAVSGATVSVPTFGGGNVRVKVPAGTASGSRLRVKGQGVPAKRGGGDLIVTIEVAVPRRLNKDAKKALEAFEEATAGEDVRAGLTESPQV